MKTSLIILFTLSLLDCKTQTSDFQQDSHLLLITENGKFGYINSEGQIIIKPIFLSAGDFSEGLAAARIKGTYGFINITGKFFIQPQFDFATQFNEGVAVVYKNAQAFIINKTGEKISDISFKEILPFEYGRALVATFTEKRGFINKKGKVIIDTVFSRINQFVQGYAVVYGLNHRPYPRDSLKVNFEVGVIDILGNFIIPYGKYESIEDFENGYFKVVIPAEPWDTIQGYTAQTGIIDNTGKLIVSRNHGDAIEISGNFHCGLAKISFIKKSQGLNGGTIYISKHMGFINTTGEIVINDSNFRYVSDFSEDRAFAGYGDRKYYLINTEGKILSDKKFTQYGYRGFKNGIAFVSVDDKWGIIDKHGSFIVEPKYNYINEEDIIGDQFFYNQKISEYNSAWGLAKKDGSILIEPVMDNFDRKRLQNGIIKCTINEKPAFINKEGIVIWQGKDRIEPKTLSNLNIAFINMGHIKANSLKEEEVSEDQMGRSVLQRKISKENNFAKNRLSVTVNPEIKDTVFKWFNGIRVYVANTTNQKIKFHTQDNRLYMNVQALNKSGEWKDIDYLHPSFCGNSYYPVELDQGYFWSFATPVYDGDFKTKLRIKLLYADPDNPMSFMSGVTIYSNEYDGNINPGQLWRLPESYPIEFFPYF
jgi:hypothetical protein